MNRRLWTVTALAVGMGPGGCDKPRNGDPAVVPASASAAPGDGLSTERAERAKRGAVIRTVAYNFAANGYAPGGKWPNRVADILPATTDGRPVDPTGYRLAPAPAGRPGEKTPVVYEAVTLQEAGFVGYADGSSQWLTAAELKAELPGTK